MRTRAGVGAAALFLLIGRVAAQQAPGSIPSFRSGTELVTVDVGVIDKQGTPIRGLSAADFTVTVEGQPRRVVTAEFVDAAAARLDAGARAEIVPISTNEGAIGGRQVIFVVDQNTLEPGSARRVADAAGGFFAQLSPADRSALVTLPVGNSVPLTWAHERVREGLRRVAGLNGSAASSWEYGTLSEARDISNANSLALRIVGDRECRNTIGVSAANGGASSAIPSASTPVPIPPGGATAGGTT